MPKKCWCGNADLKKYSDSYYKCDECFSLVSKQDFSNEIYTVVDEKHDLYGLKYWNDYMLNMIGLKDLDEVIDYYITERAAYWLSFLLQYKLPPASIVEIGCGLGQFSYLAKKTGYEQIAYEMSPSVCKFIDEKLHIHIENSEFKQQLKIFDVFSAFDVFEHLLEPKVLLEQISFSLKSDGLLVLQMPCYDETLTYEEMLEKKPNFNSLLRSEQHIYLYSKKSAKKILSLYDFNFINFEHAIFGDDYDMFLFASRLPLVKKSQDQISNLLNSAGEGRLIKALVSQYDDRKTKQEQIYNLQVDQKAKQNSIDDLVTDQVIKQKIIVDLVEFQQVQQQHIEALSNDQRAKQTYIENLEADQRAKQECIDGLAKDQQAKQECIDGLAKDQQAKQECIDGLAKDQQAKQECIDGLAKDQQAKQECIDGLAKDQQVKQDKILCLEAELSDIYSSRTWSFITKLKKMKIFL